MSDGKLPWYKSPFLKSIGTALALGLSPFLCALIPNATGTAVCNAAVKAVVGAVGASSEPVKHDGNGSQATGSNLPKQCTDCEVCPEEKCLSTGYALPLDDGGSCRCNP